MSDFISFMRSAGVENIPDITPGKIARFGKNKNQWALLFPDCEGGVLGDWSNGEQQVWQSGSKAKMNDAQFKQKIKEAQQAAQLEREQSYAQAAIKANEIWNEAAQPLPGHTYLKNKQVGAHRIKQLGNELVIPVCNVMGDLQSLQFIRPDGSKRFLSGGKMSAGCHMIGFLTDGEPITICEGYATGATLYETGSAFVVVAFSASNLIKVANALKEQLPGMDFVIAGDLDPVGKKAADEAAAAVSGISVFPYFGEGAPSNFTDFNDLRKLKHE